MTDLARRLASLSPQELDTFERRLDERGLALPDEMPIRRHPDRSVYPLAYTQQRLWFLQHLDRGSTAYHVFQGQRLGGPIDPAVLERVLDAIVARHAVLRSAYATEDDQPVQVVRASEPAPLPRVDLTRLDDGRREPEAQRLGGVLNAMPFDLTDPPRGRTIRALLVRLGPDDHVLFLSLHHIAADGWSFRILKREILALYRAFALGRPSPLPELPIQYGDYALWQLRWLRGSRLEKQLDYWRTRLDGAPDVLDLPTDRPRPEIQSFRGAVREITLPPPLTDALQELARRERSTLFTVLVAAFQLLLARWSGSRDLCVGVPVAGRSREETEPLIGLFLNTVVLRSDLDGRPGFRELLGRVGQSVLDAQDHQDLPFERLVQELRPERNLATTPLFQALFAMQVGSAPSPRAAQAALSEAAATGGGDRGDDQAQGGGGFRVEPFGGQVRATAFDMNLEASDEGGSIRLSLTYRTDLFDTTTMARFLWHYGLVLSGAVETPDRPVWALPMLTPPERQALLERNDTATRYPRALLPELFARRAAEAPDRPAVIADDEQLTYGELERRSRHLAATLRRRGIGPDVVVGLLLERSAATLVAIWGILRAGGAYLPLDPGLPWERLAFMMDEAFGDGPAVVVTRRRHLESLPPERRSGALLLDEPPAVEGDAGEGGDETGAGAGAGAQSPSLPATFQPESLIYTLYTSGSTGRPKGVMNSHGAVLNRLLWMQQRFPLGPDDRVFQKTPLSFDVSAWELLWPHAVGATQVVARPDGHRDPGYLARRIEQEAVTIVHFVPSMLRLFLETPGVEQRTRALSQVVASGEELPVEVAEACRRRLGVRVANLYGPTEAAIDVSVFGWDAAAARLHGERQGVPIGRPIANLGLYELDAEAQPVPPGVVGQLGLAGDGLARGYRARPALTAERFVPHPLAGVDGSDRPAGGRVYLTGDLARVLPAGEVEFLGRLDHQVKVRGFRIELGEIEAVLVRHPAVQDAVVVAAAAEDGHGSRRLVAYAATGGAPGTDPEALRDDLASALRDHLAASLPDYMVPAQIVLLDALPRLTSGKIDRRALPAPGRERPATERRMVAPRNEVEERLAALWRELLHLDELSVEDGFFALGGDSILGLQMIFRAGREGLLLEPQDLFRHPTLADLASVVRRAPDGGASETSEATGLGPATGELPLTPVQRWFFDQQRAAPHHFNQTLFFRLDPAPRPELVGRAVAHLLRHHDALRLRVPDGGRRAVIDPPGSSSQGEDGARGVFAHVDLERLAATAGPEALAKTLSKARTAAAASLQASLDLADGPLIRVVLFTAGADRDARLLFTVHHLAVDGVSWRILLDDLATLYRQLSTGHEPALPAKTAPFRRWAELLAERATAPETRATLEAWRRIAAPTAPLRVDAGAEAGEPLEGTARRLETVLDRDATRAVLVDAHRTYGTNTEEILLAAVARALGAWSGREEIVLDREGHGRDVPLGGSLRGVDLTRTVGWFTAVHPARLPAAGGPGSALKGVKEALREVPRMANGGAGYGLLRYLGAEEDRAALAELPAREVLFNYLGQLDRGGSGPGPGPDSGSGPDESSGESLRLTLADEPPGPAYAPSGRRSHLLELDARVVGERLRLALIYSPERHHAATAEALLAAVERELRALLAHCAARAAALRTPDLTPSDVPLAGLDAEALDALRTGTRGIVDLYPLSPLQEGILFHSVYAPESRVYDMQLTCTIGGAVDPEAFRRAWQRLVDRHTVLRSSFLWDGLDRPLQAVHRRVEVPFRLEDWRGLPASETDERQRRLQEEELAPGFDLGEPPLLRLALARLGEASWRFVWTHHHLPLDGWSLPPLFAEVFRHYRAEVAGEAVRLEPVRPYRDYIAWLEARDPAAAEAFWRSNLAGFFEATPLPDARSRGGAPRSDQDGDQDEDQETDRVTDLLTPDATEALRALGRRCGVTLGTVVQAAWALLLGRHAGTDDVVFGATVSGRPADLDGAERMLGLFINTLPMRVALPREETVEGWLREVQGTLAEARGYEYAALAAIQGWSEMPPGQPLFETLVVFENYPAGAAVAAASEGTEADADAPAPSADAPGAAGGRRPSPLRVEVVENVERTNFPLVLQALPGDRLELRLGYRRARLDRFAVERLMGRLRCLLDAMAAAPGERPETLALISAAERHQLLHEWNDTGAPTLPAEEALVHWAIEQQAARQPERVAVVAPEATLTYGELARRAGSVARRLTALGIGPGSPVGVYAKRSADRVAVLLGILQAGGCFVPLAVEAPPERLSAVLDEVLPTVVVAGEELADRLPPHAGAVLGLSEAVKGMVTGAVGEPVSGERSPVAPVQVTPEHPAYVIYTSGSTGRPKGVVISHRSAAQWLVALASTLLPEDAYLQRASLSFDPAVAETLAPLCGGTKVVLAPTEAHQDVDAFDRLMVDHRISHAAFPPQVLELLAERGRPTGWLAARRVLVGGETVPPELPGRLYRQLGPQAAVLHRYGPTETTIVVLSWQCPRRGPTPHRLPLGRPIPRTEVYVADATLRPMPPGAAGELLIGGVYLAQGYFQRPATTAERFVPDPFSGRPGARLYRSGDLTARRPDGTLEFLGRVDRQIKIRGFRVELEEIEAVLRRHPEVREAVVEMRHDPAGRRLVAYLETRSEIPVADLRDAAAEALPAYMVPAAWVMLPTLPRLPSRKVDRKALPAPAPPERAAGAALRAPSTAREEALAAIWRKLLHLEEVGVDDNFFELGGDSILTLQVVSRAARAGLRLTPKQVFENPTIAEQAEVAHDVDGAAGGRRLGAAGRPAGPTVGQVPMTPIQREFFSIPRTDRHHFNQAVALRVEPAPRMDRLERAVAALAEHHDLLRARYRKTPDGWRQEIAPAGEAGRGRRGRPDAPSAARARRPPRRRPGEVPRGARRRRGAASGLPRPRTGSGLPRRPGLHLDRGGPAALLSPVGGPPPGGGRGLLAHPGGRPAGALRGPGPGRGRPSAAAHDAGGGVGPAPGGQLRRIGGAGRRAGSLDRRRRRHRGHRAGAVRGTAPRPGP